MIKTQQNTYMKFAGKLPILSLNITIMASLLLIFVFLGATSFLYLQSSSPNAYRQALEETFRPEQTPPEWTPLYKYHGNPTVIIYEEGSASYFYDKQGKKLAPAYRSKGNGLLHNRSEDNFYYTALMLDQESVLK